LLKAAREYRWLRSLGVGERDVLRALRLASRSTLVRANDEAVVAVPSQRLGRLPRERVVSHSDLLALLAGAGYRVVATRVGRLPEGQQVYMVHVKRGGAVCSCPASRLAGDPLCVHRLAAAIVLYQRGRLDLLEWLPAAVGEKKKWRRTRRIKMSRSRRRLGASRPLEF